MFTSQQINQFLATYDCKILGTNGLQDLYCYNGMPVVNHVLLLESQSINSCNSISFYYQIFTLLWQDILLFALFALILFSIVWALPSPR